MNYTELRKHYLKEWRLWYEMCYKCKHNKEYYVEIDVAPEWQGQQGFINFIDDMGERPSANHYLSRKDKFGDWTPANTIWVDGKRKAGEGSKYNYFDKDFYFYREMAKANNISYTAFYNRLQRGWNIKDAASLSISQVKYKNRIL